MSLSFSSIVAVTAVPYFSGTELPIIEISSEKSLLDQEIGIVVNNLIPAEIISIQAQTTDDNNTKWVSSALFQANKKGVVDLSAESPREGSYSQIDPMGLLWSMQPDPLDFSAFKVKGDAFSVTFKVFRGKQEIATKEIVRLRKSEEVKRITVQENGLVGILFLAPSDKPLPVIITLSGSNGGLGENRAQLLASHGFGVLALGYFGVEGLPSNLQDIPLEYFETAFSWLKSQSYLDGSRVGVYGASRGAELALILGSLFPESVQAIGAIVPSSVIYGGLSETPVNAWLYKNKPLAPLPSVSKADFSNGNGEDANHPVNTVQNFLEGMKDEEAFKAAAIPVEKIRAPLLLVSSGDDQMWPSTLYASQIQERLKAHKSPTSCEHLTYPRAGHGIGIPNIPLPGSSYYHPVSKKWFSMGGTIADDQHASQDSWKKTIAFFQKSLKSEATKEHI